MVVTGNGKEKYPYAINILVSRVTLLQFVDVSYFCKITSQNPNKKPTGLLRAGSNKGP